MRTVFGRDCTLTILQDNTYTAIPYSAETVRTVAKQYALAGCVGSRRRETVHTYGKDITGCFITRLTDTCAPCLFTLLALPEKPFDILMNHVLEKVVYRNVRVAGFELRSKVDGAVYLKIDIESGKDSYTEDWNSTTKDICWEQVPTWHFREGSFCRNSAAVKLVYLYSFAGTFGETRSYSLRLHVPFLHGHLLSTADTIDRLDYALSKNALMSFFDLQPESDLIDTDTGGELLVTRKFRIADVTAVTITDGAEYWTMSL